MALIAATGCALAVAGPVADREPSHAQVETPTSVARVLSKPAESILRCWQYGRLVLEESGVNPPLPDKAGRPLVFSRQDGRRDSVVVFDLQQGMCTITTAPPPAESKP